MLKTTPALLVVTLLLAACQTVTPPQDGTASRPTERTAPAPGAAAPATSAATEGSSPRQEARARPVDPQVRADWQELVQALQPQLVPCLEQVVAADRDRQIGEFRAVVEFERDGSLRGFIIEDETRLQTDDDYREVVRSFVVAMQDCTPLQGMPEDKYDMWEFFPIVYRSQAA